MLEICIYTFWKSNLQWSRLSKVNWMMGNLNQNPTQNLRVQNIVSYTVDVSLTFWTSDLPTTWKIPSQKSYATNANLVPGLDGGFVKSLWTFLDVLQSEFLGYNWIPVSFTTSITPWWIVFSCEIISNRTALRIWFSVISIWNRSCNIWRTSWNSRISIHSSSKLPWIPRVFWRHGFRSNLAVRKLTSSTSSRSAPLGSQVSGFLTKKVRGKAKGRVRVKVYGNCENTPRWQKLNTLSETALWL